MQIRKIGPQPESQFTLLSNSLLRDQRLSYRARGVMATMLSHADGYHVNAETLAEAGAEGRDAVRSAMNELVEAGYLRRIRHQDDAGQWRTDLNLYPYGDAPAADSPTPENPASVSQAVIEHQVEEQLPTSPSDSDAAPPTTETSPSVEAAAAKSEGAPSSGQRPFPIVEQRKLVDWFGITSPEQVQAWVAAWNAACAIEQGHPIGPDIDYDPQADLAIYLSRCREERRQPMASRWVRFFIEDRAKFIEALQQDAEVRRRAGETPQEREDRLNRRLPPKWDAPAETGAQS